MEEQELKRKLLVERNEIKIPKKAIFRAIDEGSRRAGVRKSRGNHLIAALSVAIGLIFVSVGFITGYADDLLANFPKVFDFFEDWSIDPRKDNHEEAFIMEPGFGYVAGKLSSEAIKPEKLVKVQPGFYDVELIQGEAAELMGNVLMKGQTFRSYVINTDNYADVTGEGVKLRMTPAKNEPEKLIDGKYIFKNRFGTFTIGKDIQEGNYLVEVKTSSPRYAINAVTTNNVAKGSPEGTKYETWGARFSADEPGSKVVHLAKGSILAISASLPSEGKYTDPLESYQVDDVTITFTRLEDEDGGE